VNGANLANFEEIFFSLSTNDFYEIFSFLFAMAE
jgi:hypothetical protein